MDNFERCFNFCMMAETGGDPNGGYTNDPADPGGETRWGVAKKSHPSLDIKNLTLEQAKDIYRNEYWNRIRGDDLELPVALVMYEQQVNQGGAVKTLQKALGVSADGVFGPKTLETLNLILGTLGENTPKVVTKLCKLRAEKYLTLNNVAEERFEKGWVWRLLDCQAQAIEWDYGYK